MSNLNHLPLPRIAHESDRRKRKGFGSSNKVDFKKHSTELKTQLDNIINDATFKISSESNPPLIFKAKLSENIDEKSWTRSGLSIVADSEKEVILFSSDDQLKQFKERLDKYSCGPKPGNKNPQLDGFFSPLNSIKKISSDEKLGRLLIEQGIINSEKFEESKTYTLDVELWYTSKQEMPKRIEEIRNFINSSGGKVTDFFLGEEIALLRVKVNGILSKKLIEYSAVSLIDFPPKVSLIVGQDLETSLQNISEISSPSNEAQGVCILDSGINSGHPLLNKAIGEATAVLTQSKNASDENGHGTSVAGLALYGDISKVLNKGSLIPELWIYSAKILNENCEFDDEMLIVNQMERAIEYFKNNYKCRVFNLSVGDPKYPYNGKRVTPWAAVLDNLAHKLDIIIVVSAGNFHPEASFSSLKEVEKNYPRYLTNSNARIIEPATACNVLTVGSLAHSDSLNLREMNKLGLKPIASKDYPSPFTRSGPGIKGSIKPEICEYGGNWAIREDKIIYDSEELSVLSLNNNYTKKIFSVATGTSLAAPKISYLAAKLFEKFPKENANLIRALIASSANVPIKSEKLLQSIGGDSLVRNLCGYGLPDLIKASNSEENNVTMYSTAQIPIDKFHIYEIPITDEFIKTSGDRKISVTLAFDPQVRHTRLDYMCTKMSFCLVRGKSIEEVIAGFSKKIKGEDLPQRLSSTNFEVKMKPSPTEREEGTLQKATYSAKKKLKEDYGTSYYLVICCHKNWAEENYTQRYAVVVNVYHDAKIDLYSKIRARLTVPPARIKAKLN